MKTSFEPTVHMQILKSQAISDIHNAALEVLEHTGLEIHTEEGRKIL